MSSNYLLLIIYYLLFITTTSSTAGNDSDNGAADSEHNSHMLAKCISSLSRVVLKPLVLQQAPPSSPEVRKKMNQLREFPFTPPTYKEVSDANHAVAIILREQEPCHSFFTSHEMETIDRVGRTSANMSEGSLTWDTNTIRFTLHDNSGNCRSNLPAITFPSRDTRKPPPPRS